MEKVEILQLMTQLKTEKQQSEDLYELAVKVIEQQFDTIEHLQTELRNIRTYSDPIHIHTRPNKKLLKEIKREERDAERSDDTLEFF